MQTLKLQIETFFFNSLSTLDKHKQNKNYIKHDKVTIGESHHVDYYLLDK